MSTGKRGAIGKEDFFFHNPSAGTVEQTFTRTTSGGGTTPITKLSARAIPVLDAPVVGGETTPFEELADTQSAKNIETALVATRKNIQFLRNFETNGGRPGTGLSSADKTRNTQVFARLVTALGSSGIGDGIYFPKSRYEFKYVSGAHILNVPIMANISLVGSGLGTVLAADPTDAASFSLIDLVDTSGIKLIDMSLDYTGGGLAAVNLLAITVGVSDVIFENLNLTGGSQGFALLAGATFQGNRYLVRKCIFAGQAGFALGISGFGAGRVHSNTFTGNSNLGMSLAAGTGTYLGATEVIGNRLLGAESYISISRSGTYSGSLHAGFTISDNGISNGDILLSGINNAQCDGNFIDNGGFLLQVDFTSPFGMRLSNNQITSGLFNATYSGNKHGIYVLGAGSSMEGLEIAGGRIRSASHHGIKIQMETGTCRYGSIHDVLVNNPNRAAGNFSGIFLGDGAAKSCKYMNIHHNQIITDTNTRPDYGIKEEGATSNSLNFVNNNIIRGYIVEDVTLLGAGSIESSNFDCGAPLAP